jgi:DNA-binding HxlR family transcriptional regulator
MSLPGWQMPTSRSYGDACPIARALDVVGERWALMVVRELLLGPQRFSDLRRALPQASSNLVTDRLRELELRGVIHRRRVPSPANAWVYELTEWGRELEPILLSLGDWGAAVPLPPTGTALNATSALPFLRSVIDPDGSTPTTVCHLELEDRVWTLRIDRGELSIDPGAPADPDVSLRTEPDTLSALIAEPDTLDTAVA